MDFLKMYKKAISKDKIIRLLQTTPEALEQFEQMYQCQAMDFESENLMEKNARKVVADAKAFDGHMELLETELLLKLQDIETRIVKELCDLTSSYVYRNNKVKLQSMKGGQADVTSDEIGSLPEKIRPDFTGYLARKDIGEDASHLLLFYYDQFLHGRTSKRRLNAYHHFRQGLDLLDLDPVTYAMIDTNPNSMGHWFPALVEACKENTFFLLPETTIIKVPLSLLQLTRLDYGSLSDSTKRIVNQWAYQVFELSEAEEYFIKTGTYSSKFDFRNAYVHDPIEVREIGEYLLCIHNQAIQMAGPLCNPSIYGVSTTTEWVVRKFIPDPEGNPCIYKGLPLRTEYRVFIDCDKERVIGISPYWEPDTMKKRFGHSDDSDSPHQIHDYFIYCAQEPKLMKRYEQNKDKITEEIAKLLPYLHLSGQWSVDVMQNGNDFWIIDMALAQNSAFYECVPENLRIPVSENWIPKISSSPYCK